VKVNPLSLQEWLNGGIAVILLAGIILLWKTYREDKRCAQDREDKQAAEYQGRIDRQSATFLQTSERIYEAQSAMTERMIVVVTQNTQAFESLMDSIADRKDIDARQKQILDLLRTRAEGPSPSE
jgi:hypothetical protein